MTQERFADLLGLNINTLRGYEKGVRTPGADTISDLCQKTGASPEWILLGYGPVYAPGSPQNEPSRSGTIGEPTATGPVTVDGVIMVPKVRARLSAGNGSLETDGDVTGHYAFRAEWLLAKGSPKRMVLMEVSGDSMEPMLANGDTVLINQAQTDVLAGKIYAVGIEDTVVVKQVDKEPGKLVLRSFNPRYQPMEVPMSDDTVGTVRIIGRVIWWCHEAL